MTEPVFTSPGRRNFGPRLELTYHSAEYAASTRCYLEDRLAECPWVTRTAFPAQVVTRLETQDLLSQTTLVTTRRYRHGHFNGAEREFRGFACVEQRDVEAVVGQFDLSPVVTRSWFHTGASLEGTSLEAPVKGSVNHEYFTADSKATFLPDTLLPSAIDREEAREAMRALKGSLLRQEILVEDDSPKASGPISVSERSYAKISCRGFGSLPAAAH
jgi:hypothetical protein